MIVAWIVLAGVGLCPVVLRLREEMIWRRIARRVLVAPPAAGVEPPTNATDRPDGRPALVDGPARISG